MDGRNESVKLSCDILALCGGMRDGCFVKLTVRCHPQLQ